ncbi:hypothetical protein LOK80_00105 [Xylella fastidiosa subsp. multiplex]|uniref:hypothetical protein n=1 Tax=Xylella fastidiosa TaxID=2371 RepID=UPI00234CC255|nr:hypothetical protein [Xylella fastidiosa]MDC6409717.1 hypothetical protein [Xylella fastidiosa subsp. multiplex]
MSVGERPDTVGGGGGALLRGLLCVLPVSVTTFFAVPLGGGVQACRKAFDGSG